MSSTQHPVAWLYQYALAVCFLRCFKGQPGRNAWQPAVLDLVERPCEPGSLGLGRRALCDGAAAAARRAKAKMSEDAFLGHLTKTLLGTSVTISLTSFFPASSKQGHATAVKSNVAKKFLAVRKYPCDVYIYKVYWDLHH